MKKTIRLNQSGLRNLIRESVKRVLMETELTYDVDNFSGRWNKTEPNMDDFIDPEGYLDDPNNNPHHGEEWDEYVDDFGGDVKAAEEDYSWNLHDTQPVAPGVGGRYNVFSKHGVARDIDDAIAINNRKLYGDEKAKDRIAKRARAKWTNGKNSPEDIEDWTKDMRFTRPEAFGESKLHRIVKESVKRILSDSDEDRKPSLRNIVRESLRKVVNEARVDNPSNNLEAVEAELSKGNFSISNGKFEAELAAFLCDNGLDTNVLLQYPHIYQAVDKQTLSNEINKYNKFLEQEKAYDRRQESQAWAEEQMANMGFDEDSLA